MSVTDAEIMSLPTYEADPNVPECYLNFHESHGYLPKPHEALRLVNAVPSVMVCNRSLANINAIRVVFILVTLHLCVSHVWENLVSYMGGVRAHVRTEVLTLANRMLSASTAAESKRLYGSIATLLTQHSLNAALEKLKKLEEHLPAVCDYSHQQQHESTGHIHRRIHQCCHQGGVPLVRRTEERPAVRRGPFYCNHGSYLEAACGPDPRHTDLRAAVAADAARGTLTAPCRAARCVDDRGALLFRASEGYP